METQTVFVTRSIHRRIPKNTMSRWIFTLTLLILTHSLFGQPFTRVSQPIDITPEDITQPIPHANQPINLITSDNSVLVTLKSTYGSVNAKHDISIFGDIGINSIKDLTVITGNPNIDTATFRQILLLTLTTSGKQSVINAVERLKALDFVENAEPNSIASINLNPNDPYFTDNSLWGLIKIQAPLAWDTTTGSHAVKVGIMDTGIANHPDLVANITDGWDFYYNVPHNPNTLLGEHGTHVSGIVGGVGDNGLGIVGVNWDVSLVPMRIDFDGNSAYYSTMIEAITWGINNEIPVLNMSFGGFGEATTVRDAIANYPGLFVWAAGNAGTNTDAFVANYGSFDLPNLISVGNTTSTDARQANSNYGLNTVNIYAPGTDILSTVFGSGYDTNTGTSMSAPCVTGVAALVLSVSPDLTSAQLKTLLSDSADSITISTPSGTQNVSRVNAYNAIGLARLQPRNLTYVASGQDVTFSWQAPLNTVDLMGYLIYRDETELSWINTATHTYTDSNVPNGVYTYTLTACYELNVRAPISMDVTAGYVINITTQPVANLYVIEGNVNGTLSLTATVSQGIPLGYTWYSNTTHSNVGGTPVTGQGEDSPTYTLPAELGAGIYYYFCEVYALGATPVRSNVTTVGVAGTGNIAFLDENGNMQSVDATSLTGTESTLTTGWYYVPNNITYSQRLTISTPDHGEVAIILGDNAQMTASGGGINVGTGNNLRIYAQSNDTNMGRLTANGGANQAAIGGDVESAGGNITIVGGIITATAVGPSSGGGYSGGAGIGGGGANAGDPSLTSYESINIYGGIITAQGSWGGSGIGCGGGGWNDITGRINILGGTISTRGGTFDGYGIAGGVISTISGDAVLVSSCIDQDNSIRPALPTGENMGPAIVYNNGMGTMYGNVTLSRNVTIPANSNLFITNGQTLTIQEGFSLTNNGNIIVEDGGNIVGTVLGNQPILPVFTISGGAGYVYTKGILLITTDGAYSVGMRAGVSSTTSERIVIAPSVNADITLSDVSINMSNNVGLSAFDMTGATVNLTLLGSNTLRSGGNRAGLEVTFGSTLNITEASTGSLVATAGNYGAGIGGRGAGWTVGTATCGTINIAGGTITATGGFAGAGIGNGQGSRNSGLINISGGNITASGSTSGGAGIGDGQAGNSDITINISGGRVTATGSDYSSGYNFANSAAIGGAWSGGAVVNITGGIINARCGTNGNAYDIGTGNDVSAGALAITSISITGGSVFAAHNLITDRWEDGITRYPVKVTVKGDDETTLINNAQVSNNQWENPALTGGHFTNTGFSTVAQGVAWLWLPDNDEYVISATNDLYYGYEYVYVEPSDDNPVTIILSQPVFTISGSVVYGTDLVPIPNAHIRFTNDIFDGYSPPAFNADDLGAYSLQLPAGTYNVTVTGTFNGTDFTYNLFSANAIHVTGNADNVMLHVYPNSDDDVTGAPIVTALKANYPNPFNPSTTIAFAVGLPSEVSIDIYNVRGQKVRTLVSGMYEAGVHNVVWNGVSDDGRSVGSGVYFYRMVSGDFVSVKKMLMLK